MSDEDDGSPGPMPRAYTDSTVSLDGTLDRSSGGASVRRRRVSMDSERPGAHNKKPGFLTRVFRRSRTVSGTSRSPSPRHGTVASPHIVLEHAGTADGARDDGGLSSDDLFDVAAAPQPPSPRGGPPRGSPAPAESPPRSPGPGDEAAGPPPMILSEHSVWTPPSAGDGGRDIKVVNLPSSVVGTLRQIIRPLVRCMMGGFLAHLLAGALMTLVFGLGTPSSIVELRTGAPLSWLELVNFCVALVLTGGKPPGSGPCAGCSGALWLVYVAVYMAIAIKLIMMGVFFVYHAHAPPQLSLSRWVVITRHSVTGLQSLEFRILNNRGPKG